MNFGALWDTLVVHFEIPWCISTTILENFIQSNLIHPVKDGEHICDRVYSASIESKGCLKIYIVKLRNRAAQSFFGR